MLIYLQKPSVEVFGGEVQSLCGKVADDVDSVASPERNDSFFLDASGKAVDYS